MEWLLRPVVAVTQLGQSMSRCLMGMGISKSIAIPLSWTEVGYKHSMDSRV